MTRDMVMNFVDALACASSRSFHDWLDVCFAIRDLPRDQRHRVHSCVWKEIHRTPCHNGVYDVPFKEWNYWMLINTICDASVSKPDIDELCFHYHRAHEYWSMTY